MSYRRHSPEAILNAAVETAMQDGLASLTFSAVGRRLGISDRTVVYYFPTKSDLTTAVLGVLGERLRETVAGVLDAAPMTTRELLEQVWPILATPANDRVFALFFEVVGLGSDGSEPYRSAVRALVTDWCDWLEPRIVAASGRSRRATALGALAQIDGLLLLRSVADARTADLAADALMNDRNA
ncbi:TetR/AcrR family transcriptional regulator [Anaerosoma tenue]|uniref:TetR/AcrR family transcriptional regulator n=1 Tax=Anaerosoma tenue TaxID=2933588 RepID=UPI002260C04A|nr:TetR/AcrR family transcriptional regulator [Anaerosoma tenue]MCK8115919.1 TetR/AcrR family transcriptional regulator [Anaerosoma tenue]